MAVHHAGAGEGVESRGELEDERIEAAQAYSGTKYCCVEQHKPREY